MNIAIKSLLALLPLGLLAGVIYLFALQGPGPIGTSPIPIERIDFERIVFRPDEMLVYVRNSGPSSVTVAHVIVNGALWSFSMQPAETISRLERATIALPYPWIEGEPVAIELITPNGFKFAHEVGAAVETPQPSWRMFAMFALLGTYVGVIPVFLGFFWFPFLRRLGSQWMGFLLSLTAGLLIFLGVDALKEAFELAGRVSEIFKGVGVITGGFVLSFLALIAIGQRTVGTQKESGRARLALSYLIAAGIGFHNLGEGLAIGAAYALGEVALGAFLVIGFMIHNTTEGLGIVAPVARENVRIFRHLLALGLIAGAPTILGAWIGGFTYSDVLSMLFLAVGAGAIFQVVYEIFKLMAKDSQRRGEAVLGSLPSFTGLALGFFIMYITGLFVAG
jgi:ZIP family zinc transporter